MAVTEAELAAILDHCRALLDAADEVERAARARSARAETAARRWDGPHRDEFVVRLADEVDDLGDRVRRLRVEADAWAQVSVRASLTCSSAMTRSSTFGATTRSPCRPRQAVSLPPGAWSGSDLLGLGRYRRSRCLRRPWRRPAAVALDDPRDVGPISSALKRVGTDLGAGMHWAPTERLQAQLDRTDVWRLDRLEQALQTEGFDPDVARRLREQVDGLVADDPRFELGGATLSEPAELLDQELRSALTADQYEQLQTQLAILDQRQLLANRSLIGDAPGGVELDTDIDRLAAEAAALYQDNQVGLAYGGGYRLNEPEIAYRLQKLAEDDPGRSLAVKWLLDGMLTPHARSELDRVLATNGSFGERVGVATAHPADGLVGAAKGFWNDNAGWLLDGWADAEVAITNGFHTMATNQGFGRPAELDRALPRSPRTWAENDDIVELEFMLDNLAEQGGADLAVAIELASAAYGGGKGGVGLVRVGRRYFLRNGDDLVVSLGPRLTGQLDEGVRYRPLGRGSTVNPDMNRFHPRSLRERLAIDEVMQRRPRTSERTAASLTKNRGRSTSCGGSTKYCSSGSVPSCRVLTTRAHREGVTSRHRPGGPAVQFPGRR